MKQKLSKMSRKIQELNNQIPLENHSLENVLSKLLDISQKCKRKFDESVDIVLELNLTKKDQGVRSTCSLPHGNGKVIKIAAFAEGAEATAAQEAGAHIVGGEELITKIKNGEEKLNVQKCVATPSMMLKLTKIASILGKRGLMPNQKDGTISDNLTNIIKEIKKGLVFFHSDKTGYIHASVGKVSFPPEYIISNIRKLISSVKEFQKNTKVAFLKSLRLSTTMSISIKVDLSSF